LVEERIWVWSVDKINWDTVKTKKIWAVDNEKKKEKVQKNDTIVFYVAGTKYFQGIFKVISEWETAITAWPDGRQTVAEINLEKIETGYASIRKLVESLDFVKNPSAIGTYLMGVSYGPSNFGKPISLEDFEQIKNEMKKNKAPQSISKDIEVDSPEDFDSRLKNSPIRLHLIKSLFDNLMGPKKGPGEEIQNVNQAYTVGILRTKFNKPVQPVEPELQELEVQDGSSLQELTDDEEEKISPDYDLNPVLGARSLGMSFLVNGTNPKVRICATWGRYEKSLISKKTYRRQMNYFVAELDISKSIPKVIPEELKTKQKRITKKGVELEVITSKISDEEDKYHVSIFLINNTKYLTEHQSAEEAVYQPQIRVNVSGGKLYDLGHLEPETESEKKENALFATRRSFGRGHFCGVLWKDVDPEDFEEEGFSTFNWPDSRSKFFEKELIKEYTRPDIRTEFFPTYSILQPDLSEKSNVTFNAEEFSNEWDSEIISQKLSVLVVNYRKWISKEKERIRELSSEFAKDAAEENLKDCETTANRIDAGMMQS